MFSPYLLTISMSIPFYLAFPLLESFSVPNQGLGRRDTREYCPTPNPNNIGYFADPEYPVGYDGSTCTESAFNPFIAPLIGHDKRSLSSSSSSSPIHVPKKDHEKRVQGVCTIIARQVFNHYMPDNYRVANTGQVRLLVGINYMFSISTCAMIDAVKIWLHNGGADYELFSETDVTDSGASVSFQPLSTGDYHFEVTFKENIFQSGALRLYRIGPG